MVGIFIFLRFLSRTRVSRYSKHAASDAGTRRPPIRQINCSLSHKISIRFQNLWFIFHVSFLVSCFTFQNTEGALSRSHSVFESLPQRFWIAPTVFLFFSLSVFSMKLRWEFSITCPRDKKGTTAKQKSSPLQFSIGKCCQNPIYLWENRL